MACFVAIFLSPVKNCFWEGWFDQVEKDRDSAWSSAEFVCRIPFRRKAFVFVVRYFPGRLCVIAITQHARIGKAIHPIAMRMS